METKEQVIRLFLAFLSRYVPLGQAQLATLGGSGLEAEIWSELGIPTDHGWLIERSRERNVKLIKNHRYNIHNQLGTFNCILAGHGTDRAFVDGFHLDLCGTLCNKAIGNFESIVPLVLASTGRCLAITVADARRNLVLEQWPSFQARAKRLFGAQQSEAIYDRIAAHQRQVPTRKDQPAFIKPFDPAKAAKREFGLLVELTELLRQQKLPWIPVAVERYIYVSRFATRPFRMRTYLFRFGEKSTRSPELAFAQAWITSKLSFANGEAFHEVKAPAIGTTIQPTTKGVITMMPITSRLGQLAKALGGAEETEYNKLLGDSQQLAIFRAALNGVGGNGVEPNTDTLPSPSSTRPRKYRKSSAAKQAKKVGKMWADLSDEEKIEWQLKTIEAKAQNGDLSDAAWRKMLKTDFGHYNDVLDRSLHAALSRTNGGFRPSFENRIKTVFGEQAKPYLDRLAKVV